MASEGRSHACPCVDTGSARLRAVMTSMRHSAFLLVVLLAVSGCGQDRGRDARSSERPSTSDPAPASTGPRIESLPQVDVSGLGAAEKRRWVTLANDLLSPCGEPVSVARCVSENRTCRRCVPAARYLARLAGEGYTESEIRPMFQARYGRNTEVDVDIEGAPVLGAPMAAVTIVEFSDYECPHCRAARPVLDQIVREFDGRVRLVHMFYPLRTHEHAANAALAAACAQAQGEFWEMHELLFEHQDALETQDLASYARQIGLDMERFEHDLVENQSLRERVLANVAEGRRVGVDATPTIFINRRKYEEPPELEPLRAYIREELEQ